MWHFKALFFTFPKISLHIPFFYKLLFSGQGQDPEVVNSTNDAGYTALHHAARHGSRELIEILLKANADRMIENNAGETPYMVAQRSMQFEAERLLLNVEQQHGTKLCNGTICVLICV